MSSKLINLTYACFKNSRIIFNGAKQLYSHEKSAIRHFQSSRHQQNAEMWNSIQNAKLNPSKELLQITTSCGKIRDYPCIWLRDNCQCSSCFNPQLQSRTIDWRYVDITVQPQSVQNSMDAVIIKWSDDHESKFTSDWLQERSFTKENHEKWLHNTYRLQKVPWHATNFLSILKRFNFRDVIESDRHLYEWLRTLAIYGVAIVENTPRKDDQVRKLASRISFIKRTHYGEEFEVRNKPDTTNVAYLSTPLQMHADLPYYEYKPGVNLLHCIEQTIGGGGENQLTDCLHVSRKLKEKNPEVYKTLTSTQVEWSDIGEEKGVKFFSLFRSPALCEDETGSLKRVNYSQQQRDSHFSIPLEDVIPWYKAHAVFTQELYNPENMVLFKTKPGDILTFDNIRLVHGRTGYTDTESNERYLIGAYLDWDIINSRIRVLQKQLDSD